MIGFCCLFLCLVFKLQKKRIQAIRSLKWKENRNRADKIRQESDGVAEWEGPTQLHSEFFCFRAEGPEAQKDVRNFQMAPSYVAPHQRLNIPNSWSVPFLLHDPGLKPLLDALGELIAYQKSSWKPLEVNAFSEGLVFKDKFTCFPLCLEELGFIALHPMAASVKAPGYASEITPVILESGSPYWQHQHHLRASLLDVQMLWLYPKRPESDAPGLCPAV